MFFPYILIVYRFAEYTPVEEKEPEKSPWQMQIQWEETHLGNFRLVKIIILNFFFGKPLIITTCKPVLQKY